MGDMGGIYRAMDERAKEGKARRMSAADTTGWTQHTPYHFTRMFGNVKASWWPSTAKLQINNKMYYGERQVYGMIALLKRG